MGYCGAGAAMLGGISSFDKLRMNSGGRGLRGDGVGVGLPGLVF